MQVIIINQQKKIRVSQRAVKALVDAVFKTLEVESRGQLSVVYVNNKTIQELNNKFLGRNEATDVLCFDLSEKGTFIADIVISAEMARENSRRFKTSFIWEISLYLVHGILHLFGFSDRKKKDRVRMQKKAEEILKSVKLRSG